MRLARATAPPDITMLRDAKVPNPKAVLSVSPWRTEIRAGLMPSSSAGIRDRAVSSSKAPRNQSQQSNMCP